MDMLKLAKKYRWVCIAILIYLIGISFFAFANYKYQKEILYADINSRLINGVNGTLNILNNELGVNIRGEEEISYSKEKEIAFKLQTISDKHSLAYVYTLIEENNKLLFISSSPTPEEVSGENEYKITYKTDYKDDETTLRKAFKTNKMQYGESHDEWGDFRSAYYPYQNADGKIFVVGSDVNLSEVQNRLLAATRKVYLTGFLFFLIGNRILAFNYPGLHFDVFHVQENVFGFLLKNQLGEVDLEKAGQKLFSSLVQLGYGQNGLEEIPVNVHIGSVSTVKDALLLANMALYEAAEKNLSMVMYNDKSELPQQYNGELKNNSLLVEAIQNDNLIAHFQPIFDIKTNSIIRYEALARIVHDNKVVLYPNSFIAIASRSRLIHKITKVIIDDVISKIQNTDIHVSINISAHDLEDNTTCEFICAAIRNAGIGSQISFELLEDQKITDYELIKKSLKKISALGCRIGLDDLGKHYSNFDRLLSLPLDFVKIDGAIISQITTKKEIINLVNDIVSFAKEKKLVTVAEFCIFCSSLGLRFSIGGALPIFSSSLRII